MLPYIEKIIVNKVRHLHDFTIKIGDKTSPKPGPVHLLLTGRNGSGKTSLLCAIRDAMEYMASNGRYSTQIQEWLEANETTLAAAKTDHEKNEARDEITRNREQLVKLTGSVELIAEDTAEFARILSAREALFAYYDAQHAARFVQPSAPGIPKVGLTQNLREKRSGCFVEFLINLKVQCALYRNEKKEEDAKKIEEWFRQFDGILKRIFDESDTHLDFEPRGYKLSIVSGGRCSPLTALSDGFSSLLDVVSDLILKMQREDDLVAAYDMPGVVLIDEVETHLHMELQRLVMPILTTLFPRLQFIVTTHSPFVLSSISNAVAFDLEHREPLDDADEYPYESLTEEYFKVRDTPAAISERLARVRRINRQEILTDGEKAELKHLITELSELSRDKNLDAELTQIKLLRL